MTSSMGSGVTPTPRAFTSGARDLACGVGESAMVRARSLTRLKYAEFRDDASEWALAIPWLRGAGIVEVL